MLTFN